MESSVKPKMKVIGIRYFKGYNIAILGQRGSGKTQLHKILTISSNEPFPNTGSNEDYETTIGADLFDYGAFHFKKGITEKNIYFRKSKDVAGEDSFQYWKQIYKESHIVIYLFDANNFLNGEGRKRIRDDIKKIKSWEKEKIEEWEKKKNKNWEECSKKDSVLPKLFCIGTHLDNKTANELMKIEKELKSSKEFYGFDKERFFCGSLTPCDVEKLLIKIFSAILIK